MYRITQFGQQALLQSSYLKLPSELTHVLREIQEANHSKEIYDVQVDFAMVNILIGIGFIRKSVNYTTQLNASKGSPQSEKIQQLKNKLVVLLKKNFDKKSQLWDILINLEAVLDRNGLVWFISKIIDITADGSKQEYESLIVELLELKEDGS